MDLHKDKASASPSDLRVSALEFEEAGMGELTAGMLIETALQIQMARATDGMAPELAECVVEAEKAWMLAFQLASGEDEKDEPGLFEGAGVAPTAEMVREEAALRQIMRTWAGETLVPLQHALLDVGDVVLDFRGMLSERCVQVAPGMAVGEMLVQEICGAFADAQVIESPRGQCFRNLWTKAVPA